MGIITAIANFFGAVGGFFKFQSQKQERFNAPDMVANADAGRDVRERNEITQVVDKSDKAGEVSEDEKKRYAED